MTNPATATYADPDQLLEWFERAMPGQRSVYARGCGLRPDNATVRLVSGWREGGTAITAQRRLGDADFEYFVGKCASREAIKAAVPAGREAKAVAIRGTPMGVLFDYIRGLIEDGLPMPLNAAIAEELNWRDKHQVRYRLNQLQLSGLIAVTFGKAEERIVRDLISDRATASVEQQSSQERARA